MYLEIVNELIARCATRLKELRNSRIWPELVYCTLSGENIKEPEEEQEQDAETEAEKGQGKQ